MAEDSAERGVRPQERRVGIMRSADDHQPHQSGVEFSREGDIVRFDRDLFRLGSDVAYVVTESASGGNIVQIDGTGVAVDGKRSEQQGKIIARRLPREVMEGLEFTVGQPTSIVEPIDPAEKVTKVTRVFGTIMAHPVGSPPSSVQVDFRKMVSTGAKEMGLSGPTSIVEPGDRGFSHPLRQLPVSPK